MTLETKSQPPEMAQRPHQIKIHGYTLSDDYFWFRDKEDPEVIPHLKRENEYVETTLKPFQQTQNKILEELKLRIKEDDESFPWKVNEYFYYWREIPGQEYKVYCRKKGSINATEQVILDLNVEAKNHNYLKLGFFFFFSNNKTIAYSLDTD